MNQQSTNCKNKPLCYFSKEFFYGSWKYLTVLILSSKVAASFDLEKLNTPTWNFLHFIHFAD